MSRGRKRAKPASKTAVQEPAPLEGEAGHPAPGGRRWRIAALLAIAAAVVVAAAVSGLVVLARSGESRPRALIVDQLDQTFPDPDFIKQAGSLLEGAGYDVRYTPGDRVTVDFYRKLGGHDYDLIILRSHSARLRDRVTQQLSDVAVLFTSEPFADTKYINDQMAGRLGPAFYYDGGEKYFGVHPAFIESDVEGGFGGATVIVMGCDALRSDVIARAFVDKGAKAVIGWNGPVSAEHTDQATERLLQHLVIDKLGVQEAVAETMSEVAPDPSSGSELRYYPTEAAVSAGN
jgi:hypothetical protein